MTVPVPPPFTSGKLGEKIERLIERALTKLYNVVIGPVGEALRAGVDNFSEQMEQALLNYSRPVVSRILATPGLPPEFRSALERIQNPEGQIEVGAVLAIVAGLLVGLIQGGIRPIAQIVSYGIERIVHSGRPDPATLLAMFHRGRIDFGQLTGYLADHGYTLEIRDALRSVLRPRLGANELLQARHRGILPDGYVRTELERLGFSKGDATTAVELSEQLPGPGDLVRFALREAWRDDIAAKYGYDADYVPEFGQWMEKLGYASDWARKYWRAHWELPSVTLGMEMVHRGIITEAEFDNLLRVSDIPAGWRDKVARVIYSPYTRVDTRRMHDMGVLDDADLVDVYKSQGYDQAHAENMALFTIRYNQADDRELTKADILNGYRDGILTYGEAQSLLRQIGFTAGREDFLLARVDAQQAKKLVDAEVRVIKDLYLNGDLTLTETQTRLTSLGLPARQIELYIQEWRIDREGKVKRPTRGTLERLYKSGAITQEEFTTTLDAIGYQAQYIGWYLTNIAIERLAETEKEEERARKERERVEKDRRKTEYQRAKATLDVEVAEVQAAIATADVALVQTQNDRAEALRAALPLEERAAIERDYMVIIHDADAAIGEARIVVAELRAEDKTLRSALAVISQSLATNIDVAAQVVIKSAIAGMRTAQARFTDAAAILEIEIARLKEAGARETDETVLEQMALELLSLQTQIAEERQAITDVEIDIREAVESLGQTMEEARRAELETEQAAVGIETADVSERIALANTTIAETAVAKTDALNAMDTELSRLPGAADALEIRKHYDTLIERIKAQVKELRVRLSGLRVQKALLTFEYRGPAG